MVLGYGHSEGDVEEREKFCGLRDLNGWVEDRMREGITGAFGVSGENDNGRRMMEFCTERRLCVGKHT